MNATAEKPASGKTEAKKELGTVVVVPKPERVRLVLVDGMFVRDDVNGGEKNVRPLNVGEVILEGTALYGFACLDKAIAGAKCKLERV